VSLLARATFGFQRNYAVECCSRVPFNCAGAAQETLRSLHWMYITLSAPISDLLLIPNSLEMDSQRCKSRRLWWKEIEKCDGGVPPVAKKKWLRFYHLVALCVFWGAALGFSKNQSRREVLKVKWHSVNSWRLRAAIFVFVCRESDARASCEELCASVGILLRRLCALWVYFCLCLRVSGTCFRRKWILELALSISTEDPFILAADKRACYYLESACILWSSWIQPAHLFD
jgi:hypothetical protein